MINISDIKYYFFIFLSLLINIIISIVFCKRNGKLKTKSVLKCTIVETIGIIVGAKILDIISNYDVYLYYINNKIFLKMITNGYAFLGGMCGATFGILIYSRFAKEDFKELGNILIPNLLLIYSISKIGCFFTDCCRGVSINGYVLPIQLIEVAIYFAIYILVIQNKNTKISLSCIIFGFLRFLIEFLREDTSTSYISFSQVLALDIFIIGAVYYCYEKLHKTNKI